MSEREYHGMQRANDAQNQTPGPRDQPTPSGDEQDIVERLRILENWNRGNVGDSGESMDELADVFGVCADEIESLRARLTEADGYREALEKVRHEFAYEIAHLGGSQPNITKARAVARRAAEYIREFLALKGDTRTLQCERCWSKPREKGRLCADCLKGDTE